MNVDEAMKPYTEFLEQICKQVTENGPISCTFVYEMKEGQIGVGYFGEAKENVFARSKHAFAIQQDAMMDTIMANADQIVEAAEDVEEENYE